MITITAPCFLIALFSLAVPSLSSKAKDGICSTATWARHGITVAGGNGRGRALDQLLFPTGLFIDENQTVYVADTHNNRVLKWEQGAAVGQVVAGGNGEGVGAEHLRSPNDVVVDKDGTIYVTDRYNKRIQKWSPGALSGETILSVNNPVGIALDNEGSLYISSSSGSSDVKKLRNGETVAQVIFSDSQGLGLLFVDENRSVYVASVEKGRVMKIDEGKTEFSIVAGGSNGNGTDQLFHPHSVVVDQSGTVYVVERSNQQVTRWPPGATSGTVIVGGRGIGTESDQFDCPTDLTFDHEGNLYVVDTWNFRVQKFLIDKSSC